MRPSNFRGTYSRFQHFVGHVQISAGLNLTRMLACRSGLFLCYTGMLYFHVIHLVRIALDMCFCAEIYKELLLGLTSLAWCAIVRILKMGVNHISSI